MRGAGLVAVALLAAAIVAAWGLGLYDYATRETLERTLDALGPWAPVAFIGLFVVGELLMVPSVLFVFAAGLIWPLPLAWLAAYAGANAAATVLFFFARYAVGDSARPYIPDAFERYERRLETQGVRTVVVIRLFTFLHPAMHWVLGLSRVRARDVLAGTAIGLLPGVTAIVVLGEVVVAHWAEVQKYGVLVLVAALVLWGAVRRRQGATAAGD